MEIDKTYIGGKVRGKSRRFLKHKTTVMGIVKRGGVITGKAVRNNKADTVTPDSIINTDTLSSDKALTEPGHHPIALNHGAEQWPSGRTIPTGLKVSGPA